MSEAQESKAEVVSVLRELVDKITEQTDTLERIEPTDVEAAADAFTSIAIEADGLANAAVESALLMKLAASRAA
jgi:hypothetical protein